MAKTVNLIILLVLLCLHSPVWAEPFISGGLTVDTSSNMLQRAGGPSGTAFSAFMRTGISMNRLLLEYSGYSGMYQHYQGVQMHGHRISLDIPLINRDRLSLYAGFHGALARYGDVTILTGYEDYGGDIHLRSYVTQSTLVRAWLDGRRRAYRDHDTESYDSVELTARIDRFFLTGTTLRGEISAGQRRHYTIDNPPDVQQITIKSRLAQSLGSRWGIWLEGHTRITGDDAVTDTLVINERVFLDDTYKSDETGFEIGSRRVFSSGLLCELMTGYNQRSYGADTSSSFWYMPGGGWEETEWSVSLIVRKPGWAILSIAEPSFRIYYVTVDADSGGLSYDAAGTSLSFGIR